MYLNDEAASARPATVVCWDLDSTLRLTRQRWHLSPSVDPASSWPIYAQACEDDDPNPGHIAALKLHHPHHQTHIVSGADISSLPQTTRWLGRHRIPYDRVTLSDYSGGERKNSAIKIEYIRSIQAEGLVVVLFYEDHPKVAESIFEETGVPVVLGNPNYGALEDGRAGFCL